MTIWLDAQLSPLLAAWLNWKFDVQAIPVRDLGLRDADDEDIFRAAKQAGVVVLTKDVDFPACSTALAHRRKCSGSPAAIPPTSACNKYCCRCYLPR